VTLQWLAEAVSKFGVACKLKLEGPGDREAAIRAPLEALLAAAGQSLGLDAVFHDEVRDTQRQVRPDYGVSIGSAIIGYIEVKAPGKGIDPAGFHGHDKRQWERQRDLPNLIYTNGTEWRLYRDGEPTGKPVTFEGGPLDTAGSALASPPDFENLITDFLKWHAAPITSVGSLVRAVAPLTRLLRGEVLDQLDEERRLVKAGASEYMQPFLGLAQDWRALLFPTADDATFADGYAQTVTFALLLARTEGISVTDQPLHEVGSALGAGHSLMGKALQLLTDDVAADFKVTLDLLVRIVGAVDWKRIRKGRRDTYLHLYENFLDEYDKDLRKQSGSYYTPREVVDEMVRLTEEALMSRLGKSSGFRDPSVMIVDPAMGTGTYLHTILERIAEQVAVSEGPGAVPGAIAQAADRMVGFEIQMGPYAVAELRATDLLASHGSSTPAGGMHLYVTDTLDDPHAAETQIGSGLQLIAQSRREANEYKADAKVTVVIGNPPYRERAEGLGGWVERGSEAHAKTARGILDDFRLAGNGKYERHLKNLYVYFWRWGTWKVWESTTSSSDDGVVCFISTAGYLSGPGFKGMRKYLREYSSEGWIIDLTPEGQTPDVPTRIFPGVRQPLAIGLFVRSAGQSREVPAPIHYRSVHGKQTEKFAALGAVRLDGPGWKEARTGWTDPLTPAAESFWDGFPALSDLQPWMGPGVKASRTWIFAPSTKVLENRWHQVVNETDAQVKKTLFKESPGVTLDRIPEPLPGEDVMRASTPFVHESGGLPTPIRTGYRSFDRQWVIPDARLMQRPGPLWRGRVPGQVFTIEQHAHHIHSGPGLVYTALIPDLHHFNGRGGRALPHKHPNGTPNFAPRLLDALKTHFEREILGDDLHAYIAGVVAHSAYVSRFQEDLGTPGIRVPITADFSLFEDASAIGAQIIWLQTYGESYASSNRPINNVRYSAGDERQPLARTPITKMPAGVTYDAARKIVVLGDGEFGPVTPAVWSYAVGGKNVIKSWVNYRKDEPGGKKTSPLDNVHVDVWDADWTREFVDLLTVLTRLVELEPQQEDLLDQVLDGEMLSMADLSDKGVCWPVANTDRKPQYTNSPVATGEQLLVF
jgi:hypothetical protein